MKSFMVSQIDGAHPSDETLLALVHRQPVEELAVVRAHIDACGACAERLSALTTQDESISELLGALDHPLAPMLVRDSFLPRRGALLRRAMLVAGSAATVAVAAAAMVPSSPLHRWLVQRAAPTTMAGATTVAPAPGAAADLGATSAPLASGIAVPAAPTMLIAFRNEQQSGTIEITRTPSGDVGFRSRGGTTAYAVTENQVAIDNQVPATTYLIDIPVAVHAVRIRMGDRTLVRWPEDSARYTTPGHPDQLRFSLAP
jgi:hypothetical protein